MKLLLTLCSSAVSISPNLRNLRNFRNLRRCSRKTLEAILCLFQKDVVSKKLRFVSATNATETAYLEVPGDTPCRACSVWTLFKDTLLNSGCIGGGGGEHDGDEACRCDDDHGEFFFSNGAVVHFYFANHDEDKSIADALTPHDKKDFSYYTAVFANPGNKPSVEADAMLDAAFELQAAGVPFFWLSTYEGKGDPQRWNSRQRETDFPGSGAKFVRVVDMVQGLHRLTRKVVERTVEDDPHFCMPGPPDEVGILLLKLLWALHHEKNGSY
ncbi:unnamed protein product [Ectocarpus sp. 13 AM-2016]